MTDSKEMKDKEYRKFYVYMAIGAAITILSVVFFTHLVTKISAQMAYDAALSVKQTMLKENVDNLISFIDASADAFLSEHPEASQDDVEAAMESVARRVIYSEAHMDGTYMWVEKVLNYDGGDDYAIRLIHPNLSDTEGSYLSTNTLNPSGVRAYEEELEGVKTNGAIYLTYDFKKLDSDEVSQKVTYSALYKRFDWIVCMGVNIDDLTHYQEKAQENMAVPEILVIIASSLIWLVLLALMLHAYARTRGKVFERKNKELKDQLEWDAVSGAISRIWGQKLLSEAYEHFTDGERNILLLLLDVDYFKQFNDNYGHDLGDKVLRYFVNAVRENCRDGDAVIRWGGDEFIALFHNVPPEAQAPLGDRIRTSIKNIELAELSDEHRISASMGFTYFKENDPGIEEVIARADEAVYEAKAAGRDNWKIR